MHPQPPNPRPNNFPYTHKHTHTITLPSPSYITLLTLTLLFPPCAWRQQLLVGQGGGGTGGSGCCEGGRTIMTDPVSGQPVCSCQYDRLAIGSYSRIGSSLGATGGVYGTTYTSSEQNPYPSIGMDSSAFYNPLVSTGV